MTISQIKYVIWAADIDRARSFYQSLGAELGTLTPAGCEVHIGGGLLYLHSGGEGKRTWTGISLSVDDIRASAEEIVSAGGQLLKPIQDTEEEPAHLAFCCDTEGNEFMLSKPR